MNQRQQLAARQGGKIGLQIRALVRQERDKAVFSALIGLDKAGRRAVVQIEILLAAEHLHLLHRAVGRRKRTVRHLVGRVGAFPLRVKAQRVEQHRGSAVQRVNEPRDPFFGMLADPGVDLRNGLRVEGRGEHLRAEQLLRQRAELFPEREIGLVAQPDGVRARDLFPLFGNAVLQIGVEFVARHAEQRLKLPQGLPVRAVFRHGKRRENAVGRKDAVFRSVFAFAQQRKREIRRRILRGHPFDLFGLFHSCFLRCR